MAGRKISHIYVGHMSSFMVHFPASYANFLGVYQKSFDKGEIKDDVDIRNISHHFLLIFHEPCDRETREKGAGTSV